MGLFSSIGKAFKKVGSWFKGSSSNVDYGSAISGLGSSALNMISSNKGLRDQFYYNSQLQKQAQDWSTQMASTAHQLEVSDMRKAGLNPILSATGGSGASAPGATGGSVGLPDYGLGEGISTALQFRQQKNQNNLADSQVWLNRKQSSLIGEQARNEAERYDSIVQDRENQRNLINAQIEDIRNQITNRDANTSALIKRYETMNTSDLMNALSNRTSASANTVNARANYNRSYGPFGPVLAPLFDKDSKNLFGIFNKRGNIKPNFSLKVRK